MSSVARSIPVPSFQALVQAFFAEHLTEQRAMSPRDLVRPRRPLGQRRNRQAFH